MLNLADATPINVSTPVSSTLNPGPETDLYKFNGTAGDILYFDVTARNGGGNAQWSLIDSFGGIVFDGGFSGTTSDVGPFALPSTGTYTLMIEGSRFDSAASYSFNIVPVSNELNPVALVFGGTVNEAIDEPGETDSYTFYSRHHSRNGNDLLRYATTEQRQSSIGRCGAAGTVVGGRAFRRILTISVTGHQSHSRPPVDYRRSGDTIGDYSFRLLNLADATAITPGTPVIRLRVRDRKPICIDQCNSGTVPFDVTARSGGNAQWSLVDRRR